jgi:hypothetical protein
MKVLTNWIACALTLLVSSGAALAQNEAACQRVQFSEEIVERFPNVRDACLDVINREGQEYAVFKAQFERAQGNTLFVRFRNPDGSRGPLTRVPTDPDFRVLVDGREQRVDQLARNQELTAYVQVSTPMVALAPARPTATLRVVPFVVVPAAEEAGGGGDQSERVAQADTGPAMPATASPMPALGALGVLLIAVAVCGAAVRRLRAAHQERLLRLP